MQSFNMLLESDKKGVESGDRDGEDYGRFVCTDEETEPIMKVKYIGNWDTIALKESKVYEIMSIEKGGYRIMTGLDEDYLFLPKLFEIVNRETDQND